jgi:hypothetical protein
MTLALFETEKFSGVRPRSVGTSVAPVPLWHTGDGTTEACGVWRVAHGLRHRSVRCVCLLPIMGACH